MTLLFRFLAPLLAGALLAAPQLLADDDLDGGLDAASREALLKTEQLLHDQAARETAVKKSPAAKQADKRVKELAGSEQNTSDVYALSTDIFDKLINDAHGDSTKVLQELEEGLKDPEKFAEKLTPEQKARLKSIAEKSPATTATKTKP